AVFDDVPLAVPLGLFRAQIAERELRSIEQEAIVVDRTQIGHRSEQVAALLHLLVPLLLERRLRLLALCVRLLAVPDRGGAVVGIVALYECRHLVPEPLLLGRCQQRRTALRFGSALSIAWRCL